MGRGFYIKVWGWWVGVGHSWFVLLGLWSWCYVGPSWGDGGPSWGDVRPSWDYVFALDSWWVVVSTSRCGVGGLGLVTRGLCFWVCGVGAMLAHLGAMGAHLGAMCAHLGTTLAYLEANVGPA